MTLLYFDLRFFIILVISFQFLILIFSFINRIKINIFFIFQTYSTLRVACTVQECAVLIIRFFGGLRAIHKSYRLATIKQNINTCPINSN